MALKVVGKTKTSEAKPKKKLKVIATEPEMDPEEPEEDLEEEVDEEPKAKKSKKEKTPVQVEVEVVDPNTPMGIAEKAYKAFQTSWYDFAKALKALRDGAEWETQGFDDMTSLCREKFPAIPATTISKFIKVVEEFGVAIEARSKTTKALPAYEALYMVAVNEKNIPKEDAMRLRKAVIECKVSTREVREVVKGFVGKKVSSHAEGRSEKRKQRDEEIGIKKVEVEDAVETKEDVEVDEVEQITSSIDKDAATTLKLVRQLLTRLPAISESMKEGTNTLIELAEASEELQVVLGDYLDRLEEVSNI